MESQQQCSQMLNESPSSVPMSNMSPEKVQKCLEENKELIMFILESQRLGRYKECEMHKAKLQWNLTFLTNLADTMSPPPPPSLIPQPAPTSLMLSSAAPPSKQQGHWLHQHRGAPSVGEPSFARQPHIQPTGDDGRQYHRSQQQQQEQQYYLGRQQQQQHFSEPKMGFERSSNSNTAQFGGGSESEHNNNLQMFDVMGNNQDGFLSNFQGI